MQAARQKRDEMQRMWRKTCEQLEYIGDITLDEVKAHQSAEARWVVLDGFVYNITPYLSAHPGGSGCLHVAPPYDISKQFRAAHRGLDKDVIDKLKIGRLVPANE